MSLNPSELYLPPPSLVGLHNDPRKEDYPLPYLRNLINDLLRVSGPGFTLSYSNEPLCHARHNVPKLTLNFLLRSVTLDNNGPSPRVPPSRRLPSE